MSSQRRVTAGLLATFASILLVWDVYVAHNDIPDDTISELLRDISYSWWSLPFIFGIVTGHLFWNQPESERKPKQERGRDFWTHIIPLGCLMVARDIVNLVWALPELGGYANLFVLVAGVFVGAKWWPQAMAEEQTHDRLHR